MTPLSQAELVRAGALYVPVLLALAAGLYRRARPVARLFPAALLSALWTLPALLLLQQINLHAHWWSYAPGSAAELLGMPVELYLGWVVLWGIVPPLALLKVQPALAIGGLTLLDLGLMPLCKSVVTLGPHWLTGELVAVLLVLLPAMLLAHMTARNTHLGVRATMQLALAARAISVLDSGAYGVALADAAAPRRALALAADACGAAGAARAGRHP